MYECQNCGGGLRYDIAAKQLRCSSCDSLFDPYKIGKETDAEENDFYEVNSFTCPQCGGSIYSMDNTAAGFCSFCGASTILESRLNRQVRPTYVIPFTVSKEDCKKAYAKMMRKAWFAPADLKDEKKIDGFRGIYMPYWLYNVEQKGDITLKGETEHRSGDYIIHEHYDLTGHLNSSYRGFSHDASSDFADSISEGLAPYDTKQMKEFAPSFLCGFYADASDVDKRTYQGGMIKKANDETLKFLKQQKAFKKYGVKTPKDPSNQLHTKCSDTQIAMFPVWFLSYRNGDRVAYATVNGQTGKVVSDIPIDQRKYLIGTFALSVPLFLILNLAFTLTPSMLLSVVALLSFVSVCMHFSEMQQIIRQDQHSDDMGMQNVLKKKERAKEEEDARKKAEQEEQKKNSKLAWKESAPAIAGLCLAGLVLFFDPVHDIYYYIAAAVSMCGIYGTIYFLIKRYNLLSTRKLPQFDNQGGDDNA